MSVLFIVLLFEQVTRGVTNSKTNQSERSKITEGIHLATPEIHRSKTQPSPVHNIQLQPPAPVSNNAAEQWRGVNTEQEEWSKKWSCCARQTSLEFINFDIVLCFTIFREGQGPLPIQPSLCRKPQLWPSLCRMLHYDFFFVESKDP